MMKTKSPPRPTSQEASGVRLSADPARALIAAGGSALLIGFFFPWLECGAGTVSGLTLATGGYPFLFFLPAIALAAMGIAWGKKDRRPLSILSLAAGGWFCLILLVSLVIYYDAGALNLYTHHGTAFELRFTAATPPLVFSLWQGISWGLPMVFAGLLLIYSANLTRSIDRRPRARLDKACRLPEHGEADSLDDLKPSWTLSGEYRSSALWMFTGTVLIFTYVWCGMSPVKLWVNRHHARDYLLGRPLSQNDRDYIEDQVRRAPSIEAQGRARAFQDNKYRGMPFESQPSLQKKFAENETLVAQFLSKMTAEEKSRLRGKARQAALVEKKGGYFPPETAWSRVKGYLMALLETIAIAVWGTLLAIACALPVSLLAAKNTLALVISGDDTWARGARRCCIFGVRRLLDACRGFNEFVMALIFVAVIGLGPFAGILALWIHTFGVLGKVFSEQIEAIESGQVEALSSTGAATDQIIVFSVLPQIMPGLVSYSLLRFESNVRSATILGFVGAGGIGFLIFDKLNGYLFREVCTMMIIIIISVGIIDFFCGKLRSRFI